MLSGGDAVNSDRLCGKTMGQMRSWKGIGGRCELKRTQMYIEVVMK